MKKLFLKSLALIMMLTMSVSMWGATQYCETASGHLGDANFGDRNACVKLTIVQSSEAGFVDVTLAMNRDLSATSKIDYVYVLYNGLPYTAGTDDNGDALDELTAHVNVGGAASGNLLIQYSNPNWGGRWQIELTDVDFTATCTAGGEPEPDPEPEPEPEPEPTTSKYCEFATGHLANAAFGDPAGRIKLTITKKSESSIGVTVVENGGAVVDYYQVIVNGVAKEVGALDGVVVTDEIEFTGLASLDFTMNVTWHTPALGAGRWTTNDFSVSAGELCVPAPADPVASTWEAADVNIAKNAPVFISARWSGEKANAVDNVVNGDNIQLQVNASQPTEWLVIDLGANVDVEKFSLTTTGDRKDKKFAICTAPAQASAPVFADGTDALAGVWKEEYIFDDDFANTGVTTQTYSVDWKNVRYIKYQATERNHDDQYGVAICEFRVKCAATKAVTGVTLDQNTASVPANKTLTLTATVAPADAANKTVIWSSSDETIAKVVDGVVTPQTEVGPVTITARTEDGGFEATCAVTVLPALATAPTTAAPVPTVEAAKVMSIYSDAYTPCVDMSNINILNRDWWDNPSMTQEEIEGNHMLHYYGRMTGMIGWEHAHVNIGTMNKVHVDIWAQEDGTLTMGPTSANPTVVAQRVLTLVGQQWNSFDLDLTTDFNKTLDLSDMFQNQFTEYSAQENLFVDNYFYYTTLDIDVEKPVMTSATLASASFTSAIINVAATDDRGVTKYIVKNGDAEVGKFTPADDKITVTGLTDGTAYTLSIYAQDAAENVSDNKVDVELTTLAMPEAPAAPDVTAKDYRAVYAPSLTNMLAHDFALANWGSAAGTKMTDKGYIFYHTTNNATVVWGENNAGGNAIVATDEYKGSKDGLDASAMEFMHVDIWADKAGCNSLVLVVNDHNVGSAQTLNAGWNSLDIALSGFNPSDPNNNYLLDNVAWIKFVGLNNTNDVAITNVYFWISTSTTKTVSATKNIAEAGTAVVKQEGVEVTEAENGSEVTFHAEANDGYLFLGWYAGAELKSTAADYVVTVDGNTTLEAKFRALNNIYCHTELISTAGDKHIFLTMKRTAENQYQVVIDSEEEMKEFSNAYIGGINGASQIKLNDAGPKAENVVLSDNKHRLTVNVTSTTPIKWNSPIYINMPGEFTFNQPQGKTVEYDVTCEPVAVESVTLNQTEATVDVEGTVTLAAMASPIYADNQTATWTSNNEAVATVVNGVVTGHAEGDATITATIDGKTATCAITVALDPTVPHVDAPAVDAEGKLIRAIYSDDVEVAIAHDFGFNPWGGAPVSKAAVEGNNYLLIDAATANNMTIGVNNEGATAIVAKDGMSDPDNEANKGLYVAEMKYCHIDIWSKVAKTGVFVQLGDHQLAAIALTDEGWQSFDIELHESDLNDAKNVRFMKVVGLPTETKVAIDNIYFWKGNAAVTGVSLNKTATTLDAGMKETLIATIAPATAANQNVTWTSSADAIATVDENGKVTAVAEGEATITVTTQDGGFTASCVVTVVAPTTKTWYGYAEKNDLGFEYALTYNLDKTVTIVITRYGTKTGIVAPSFSIDGEWKDCAQDGEGNWTRTTTKTFEAGVEYECFIQNNYAGAAADPHFFYTIGSENSKPAIEVTGMKISQDALEMAINETYTLEASVLPLAATNKSFTWSTDNTEVATVVDGLVTAIAAGTAHITATSANGKVATCTVTVVAELTEKTFWMEGESEGVSIVMSITRNLDRTLTYFVDYDFNGKNVTVQVNDGEYHTLNAGNDFTYTTTATYAEGAKVTGFVYLPKEGGGAGRVDYTYYVGSENEEILLAKTVRTLTSSNIGTICLPKAATKLTGATFYEIAYVEMKDEQPYKIFFDQVFALEAGHAYLFQPEEESVAIKMVQYGEEAADPVPVNGFVGSYVQAPIVANDGNYIVYQGQFRLAGNNVAVGANRAYIHVADVSPIATPAPVQGRRLVLNSAEATEVATGMENVLGTESLTKVIINGQMFIIRGEQMFTVDGQLVK